MIYKDDLLNYNPCESSIDQNIDVNSIIDQQDNELKLEKLFCNDTEEEDFLFIDHEDIGFLNSNSDEEVEFVRGESIVIKN
jgi:hypothetical protein